MSEWFGVSVEAPAPVNRRVAAGEPKAKARRPGPVPSITVRRAQILDRLMMGETNAEIGVVLGLSEATVKRHVALSLRLLGARNRVVAAVRWALKSQAEGRQLSQS